MKTVAVVAEPHRAIIGQAESADDLAARVIERAVGQHIRLRGEGVHVDAPDACSAVDVQHLAALSRGGPG
jgi:hypothetical protein